jgi:hypothetical protein
MDMRDSEILQAKVAAMLLSGMKDEPKTWPAVRCPNPAYEHNSSEREAEKA